MDTVYLPLDLLRDIVRARGTVSLVLQDRWRYGGSYQFYRAQQPQSETNQNKERSAWTR